MMLGALMSAEVVCVLRFRFISAAINIVLSSLLSTYRSYAGVSMLQVIYIKQHTSISYT